MTGIVAIELRWRIQGSDQPWTTARYAPDITTIVLTGLIRGETYDGEARNIGANGTASAWAPVTWAVATTNREGTAALPPVVGGNVSSRWISGTEITWSATDANATVNVTEGVLQVGEKQVPYGASSAEIPGTASEVKTVYLYYDDREFAGGTRTLGWTTDPVSSMAGYGRVLIDQVTITYDVLGGTGTDGGGDIGGGGGGSGPDGCPWEEAWTWRKTEGGEEAVPMDDLRIGDLQRLADGRYGRVSRVRRFRARMVRVVGEDGHTITCSRTGQLRKAGGGFTLATAATGQRLAYNGSAQRVIRIQDAGEGWCIEVHVENEAFVVGDDPGYLFAHHNLKPS